MPGEENKGENNRDCSANERLLHPVIGSRRGEAIHCCYCSSVSTGDKASFTWFIRMVDELTLRKMKARLSRSEINSFLETDYNTGGNVRSLHYLICMGLGNLHGLQP